MKRLSVLLLTCLSVVAAPPAPPSAKPITWNWNFDNAQFGGMTTNQFSTNIFFQVLSSVDCTVPTNAWPVLTNYQASTFISYSGLWSNSVVADGATRFYFVRVGVANGFSPFSDQFVWVPIPAPGFNPRVYGP